MSDKSFGDHTNRNIVKNPLLSSAVTGLSLEDLTHKAVLLPVTPSQVQITRSDQQQGSQARTLAHPKHDTPVFPSGDAFSNITLSNSPQTINQNVLDSKKSVNLEENSNTQPAPTQSKASAKTDDDFDVNEYIARLQGTRYVSAPLHSHLKEEQNANLDAAEENLEEINLNETVPAETQQSLTADIAQNFSRLPTVLPHVASAVFSSFSNMLSYKSKEQTPDRPNVKEVDQRKGGYDDVQFQRPPDVGVSLMGMEESKAPKEVAPPPKEPPTGGMGSFRITTKKKYAQIPGLSSGDATQSMTFPPRQNIPMSQSQTHISQNMPHMGQNMPPMGHNMLPMGQNVLPMGQNMPPMGQNMTPLGQNIPDVGQTMQHMGQHLPPTNQSQPEIGHNMLMSENHSISQGMLPVGQNIPPMNQSMPPMSQNMPSVGHYPPMDQSMPTMTQNIPQPHSSFGQHVHSDFMSLNTSFAQNVPPNQNVSAVSHSMSGIGDNLPPSGMPPISTSMPPDQNVSLLNPNKEQVGEKRIETVDHKASQEGHLNTQALTGSQSQYNIFNPSENQREIKTVEHARENQPNIFAKEGQNFFTPVEQKNQNIPTNAVSAAIIPPPPMFSNLPKRDGQPSAGKSILPPSVARRISANQPIIKPTTSNPSLTDNIFVPAPISDVTEREERGIPSAFVLTGSSFKSDLASNITSPSTNMPAPPTYMPTLSRNILPSTQMSMPSSIPPANSAIPTTFFTPSNEEKPQAKAKPMSGPQMFFTPQTSASAGDESPSMSTSSLPPGMPPSTLPPTNTSLFEVTPPKIPTSNASMNMQTSSMFSPVSVDVIDRNVPPPVLQSPPQNLQPTFLNPVQETSSSNAPHPITQMPPIASSEPPKPVPEPPKAVGAVNFRMTKKRPQYYAGPIVGVGAISNNVKPIIAPVTPPTAPVESNIPGALFSPEQPTLPATEQQYSAPDNIQASVPFDIRRPVGPAISQTSPFDINKPQEESCGTSFNMRYPESQNYEQEYNTPFDMSRDPTDLHNQPRQESKGFGIIGSLKSKLSSIDINKIQSTVTTFFDPAYNDTKIAEPDAQDSGSYQQQQFGHFQQGQSNFDIFVPNVEQSQYNRPVGFDYSHNNQYYQIQDPYTHNQEQGQNMSSYSTSSYFSNPNYSTEQVFSSNPHYENTQTAPSSSPRENIPENTERLNPEAAKPENTSYYEPYTFTQENVAPSIDKHSRKDVTSQNKEHDSNTQISQQYLQPNTQSLSNITSSSYSHQNAEQRHTTSNISTEEAAHMTFNNPNAFAQENRQIWEPQSQDNSASFYQPSFDQHQKISVQQPEKTREIFYDPNRYADENKQPATDFGSDIHENANNKQDITSGVREGSHTPCDSALNTTKYNMSSIKTPTQENMPVPLLPAASFFDNPVPISQPRTTETDTESIRERELLESENSQFANTPLPIGCISRDELAKVDDDNKNTKMEINAPVKERNLIESLSKDDIPVLGVSTVPLFGLSAMVSDNSTKICGLENESKKACFDAVQQSKSLFEENTPSSFFQSIKLENKIISESQIKTSPIDITGLSINDVKNVLVIEAPQEDICSMLKDNASSCKLENLPAEKEPAEYLQQSDYIENTIFQEQNPTEIFFRHSDNISIDDQKYSQNVNDVDPHDEHSELNICETCREHEHEHKHKESEDVTSQMIENITSRMQLSNPLTVPLAENDATAPFAQMPEFNQQLDEITHIAEETLETLQAQSVAELLDEPLIKRTPSEIRDYGWITQENVCPVAASVDHDYASKFDSDDTIMKSDFGLESDAVPTVNLGLDYEYKIDPNAIGFFGNNPLLFESVPVPTNASDEIKAEIKHTQEDAVLPRQISIATAPPEEDVLKLDEPGVIDVLSIEQDAKKDFPLEEEFVIEPSDDFLSTDDDKIELRERKRSSEDSTSNDTFTNRIEKFKKKVDDDVEDKEQKPYNSPPISMASYFDTGNYAVESHYRNSFVAMRIPPGFEEEYARKLSGMSLGSADKTPEPSVPDTSTQTKPVNTSTFMTSHGTRENIIGAEKRREENKEAFVQAIAEIVAEETKPIQTDQSSPVSGATNPVLFAIKKASVQPQIFSAFAESKAEDKKPLQTDIVAESVPVFANINPQPQKSPQNAQSLPDPINFFSANEEEPKPAEKLAAPENFNRLASYFSMPPAQPEHSKSFFELSQSQNHYRHDLKIQENTRVQKSFFELNQSQNQHIDDDTKNNIKELMKDLTSPQNIKDHTIKTVNYFTVELDNDVNKHTTNAAPINVRALDDNVLVVDQKTTNDKKATNDKNTTSDENATNDKKAAEKENLDVKDKDNSGHKNMSDNNDVEDLMNCKHCSRLIPGINSKDFVVKSAVNQPSEPNSDGSNMTHQNEASGKSMNNISYAADYDVEKQPENSVTVVNEHRGGSDYTPVKHHWFYRLDIEEKSVWRGFSVVDSTALEEAYHSSELNENTLVATDGGRYDVNVLGRLRLAVYWKEKPTNVRRCSWFYKGTTDARYVPYTEAVAEKLEDEYRHGITTGIWHRKLVLPNSEMVIMHSPSVMVHFLHSGATEAFSTPPTLLGKRVYRNPLKIRVARDQERKIDHLILLVHGAGEYKRMMYLDQAPSRPRVVRRSHEECEIEESEPSRIDHLLLLCHGVGSACDMRFRSVEEVVEDFRTTSFQLLQSHYRNSYDNGIVSRVEVLPISWHEQLHSGETGVDRRLACVTLDSIPRLRAFTNHTVLDVLFYTSPVFHQTIIDTVCSELNRVYSMFKARNPHFAGGVSLGGHSLGSVILYDLLCHQMPESASEQAKFPNQKTYVRPSEAVQPTHKYPQLQFSPAALYALGSPIAIFECIRGVESLGTEFALPTCKNFFNIFHPYDPIAYRIEPLINPQLQDVKPSQIPHHKGRKRMHLELKDTMARVGADLKQKLIESLRTTWNKWKATPPTDGQLEKVVEEEMEKEALCEENESVSEVQTTPEMLGRLNSGRRVDYVLQEAPLEMINEYLFAMSSHVGYWESEDTMLLMLREIYSTLGVQPDCTVPQQSMTVQRTTTVPQDENSLEKETTDSPSTSRSGM